MKNERTDKRTGKRTGDVRKWKQHICIQLGYKIEKALWSREADLKTRLGILPFEPSSMPTASCLTLLPQFNFSFSDDQYCMPLSRTADDK